MPRHIARLYHKAAKARPLNATAAGGSLAFTDLLILVLDEIRNFSHNSINGR
jgi:hypothetical protein